MLELLRPAFYSGISMVLIILLLLPTASMLAMSAVYFLCDLMQGLMNRRHLQ